MPNFFGSSRNYEGLISLNCELESMYVQVDLPDWGKVFKILLVSGGCLPPRNFSGMGWVTSSVD